MAALTKTPWHLENNHPARWLADRRQDIPHEARCIPQWQASKNWRLQSWQRIMQT
ncbi:hypothetical protein [Burkholderia sola]|uniref:hypothetical protein n=1 Tax=Burkholderia sola TaxID=2843302 RepID=UPI00338DCBE1